MLFERIVSEGLAHYSYLVGDQAAAVVIDPRRDCDLYIQKAARAGQRIAYILETHRNEDYVAGSVELASRTGAEIWHADGQMDYHYGQPVEDGQIWQIGRLRLRAIHSPGHTPGSMSYLLHDPGGAPWILFTGDALFAGDVGRVDFLGPDRIKEMAGLLYDTLFHKLLPLGDEIIVCPAHGAGSFCAAGIAERTWTTIGLERRHNPKLQYTNRDEFITEVAKELEYPPYFRRMEEWNLKGPPVLGSLPSLSPLPAHAFAEKAQDAIVLDTRMELGFCAGHLPKALSIWLEGVPNFAGWFLDYNRPILLVNETEDPSQAVRYLTRIGYDNVTGYLWGGMLSWHKAGLDSRATRTATVRQLCSLLDADKAHYILDIRTDEELASQGQISGALHIPLAELPDQIGQVPRDGPVYVFCGSGMRSTTAASLLEMQGRNNIIVVLGGLAGWNSITCPITF
jgi:hydroxyacylglutathione hydrolase